MFDFKKIEEEASKVWENSEELKNSIFEDQNKELFSFLEGPPTANAPPALHHLEVRTFKDIVCKYKFMRGLSVPRKGGWDTHGLPVEVQIEKKLGLKSKKEVIEYGIEKFNKECRDSVFSNIKDWEDSTKKLNYQIDLVNPYVTLDNNYIESVWWSLKELYNKGLLYEGFKVVPYCARCGTSLSSHEVSQGYKEVKDISVYIAFKLQDGEYILAWTTTPWTLPGNVALAVGPEIDYVKVKLQDGDTLILGKERLEVLPFDYEVIEEIKGKDLVGRKYEPLFDIKDLQNENSHKILSADFVTTDDGTGVVHTAGMYGEDDYYLCKDNNLPLIHTVDPDGKFNDLVPELKGRNAKDQETDIEILRILKDKHQLIKKEKYSHTYPYCWRCDSPLLYYAITSWFISTTKVKNRMIELNNEISWSPSHIKEGRFGKWLENVKDWNLSRQKFWGTPLPVWRCECGKEKIIGSVDELRENSKETFTEYDLHRPWVDNIKFDCECGKEMSRIPDLIDVWYDSGAATFAQFHYPFENREEFERRFPYDFISEAIDQTRGWFYTLHAISTMLFDKPAFKNVICAGHLLDDKGEKMSKSKGNIISPEEITNDVGIDAVRLQMCTQDPGNPKRFSKDGIKEQVLPFLTVLSNCKNFYEQTPDNENQNLLEDQWIISKLNSTIKKVSKHLEDYELEKALEKIMNFTVNDFSRTYIKITRDRTDTKIIQKECLEKVSLMTAPFAPYMAEYISQTFDSHPVHLKEWPKEDEQKINQELEEKMSLALDIIEKGLRARDKEGIGLKWPLNSATINRENNLEKELSNIVKIQLNVKILNWNNAEEDLNVTLDINITPELEAEGYLREITRHVQSLRKEAGLIKEDRINLKINSDINNVIRNSEQEIKEKVGANEILWEENSENYSHSKVGKIKDKNFSISFNKI